jgi:hypothetical protein
VGGVDYDYKEMLTLLAGYRSEESRRAHRNVSVTSFILIAAWVLGINITDVEAFGLAISKDAELTALGIAFVLLAYWFGMFLFHHERDLSIQAERREVFNATIRGVIAQKNDIDQKNAERRAKGQLDYIPQVYKQMRRVVAAYEAQVERTQSANRMQQFDINAEFVVPCLLAIGAGFCIGAWVWFT